MITGTTQQHGVEVLPLHEIDRVIPVADPDDFVAAPLQEQNLSLQFLDLVIGP
jgi:hypothetical protein